MREVVGGRGTERRIVAGCFHDPEKREMALWIRFRVDSNNAHTKQNDDVFIWRGG